MLNLSRFLSAALVLTTFAGTLLAENKPSPVILDNISSQWRYYEVWQTDVARLADGSIVRVDGLKPRETITTGEGARKIVTYKLLASKTVRGSAPPPGDWKGVDFDDSIWPRRNGTFLQTYRSLSEMCLRGKFDVVDPAKSGDLKFDLSFRGGAVVYLNGKEIGRANLPAGDITPETLADDYAPETFLNPDKSLISQGQMPGQSGPWVVFSTAMAAKMPEATRSRYLQRMRSTSITLPAASLKAGMNVLAIEVHRSAAIPEMFTTQRETTQRSYTTADFECNLRGIFWWNRVGIEAMNLRAPANAGGVVPNISRPKGVQVWNEDVMQDVVFTQWSDPNEKLSPVKMNGGRNSVASGSVIVSSLDALKDVKATAADLTGDGGAKINAALIDIRYNTQVSQYWVSYAPNWRVVYDRLLPDAPPLVPGIANHGDGAAALPIWITVNIPRDAKAGDYSGHVKVEAAGLAAAVDVPIQLHVSNWALPDSNQFTMYMGMVESPDSVALQYKVPMWSEEHWKLLDKTFALLAEIGDKEIHIPIVRHTHIGNQHSMVRWIKQADGSYKLDFSIVERYLDMAVKHLGKVPVVDFMLADTTPEHAAGYLFTELDPATGELKEETGPKWGTPESKAFLKPVMEGLKDLLAKRGMEASMMIGTNAPGSAAGPHANPDLVADLNAVFPNPVWVRVSHYWFGDSEFGPGKPVWGRIALVGGVLGVFWDVDDDKPIYGWQNPTNLIIFPRTDNFDYAGTRLGQESTLPEYRLSAEGALLSGRRHPIVSWGRGNISGEVGYDKFLGLRGIGPYGADFWPVLKGASENKDIIGRYGEGYDQGGWGTVSLNAVVSTMLEPGKDGPIASARFAMLREAIQDAQARVFLQNAILDDATRAKLGPDLADRCKQLCDERTRAYRNLSEYWTDGIVMPCEWRERSVKLYDLAAEVSAALNK